MTRVARICGLAGVVLMVMVGSARAAPLALDGGWLNSNFVFGGATFQDEGYDVNAIDVYGVPIDLCCGDVFFNAGGGSLVSITTPPGETNYRYEGGTFTVQFDGAVSPFFTAPILSLDIQLFGPIEPGANILVTYALGAGLFDAAFAALHGVPEQTGPGWMFESLRLWDGNAQSPELRADDGGGNLMIDASVPEPSLSVLAGLGLLALRLRSGARRSSRVGARQ
jgi:hypothetical protein